jgi:hypothetical protein
LVIRSHLISVIEVIVAAPDRLSDADEQGQDWADGAD